MTLTIEREGSTFEVTIVRAAVVIPVIDSDRFGDTGYIQLRVFSDNADEQFAEALTGLLAEGIDELVVDLRDNPGGLLTTAIQITSIFISEGDVKPFITPHLVRARAAAHGVAVVAAEHGVVARLAVHGVVLIAAVHEVAVAGAHPHAAGHGFLLQSLAGAAGVGTAMIVERLGA